MKRRLTVAEVQALTGWSERTIRSGCARGRVRGAIQPGGYAGSWSIPVESLVELGVVDVADTAEARNLQETLGN